MHYNQTIINIHKYIYISHTLNITSIYYNILQHTKAYCGKYGQLMASTKVIHKKVALEFKNNTVGCMTLAQGG